MSEELPPDFTFDKANGLWCMRCRDFTDHTFLNHPTRMRQDLIDAAPQVREQVRRRVEGDYR